MGQRVSEAVWRPEVVSGSGTGAGIGPVERRRPDMSGRDSAFGRDGLHKHRSADCDTSPPPVLGLHPGGLMGLRR